MMDFKKGYILLLFCLLNAAGFAQDLALNNDPEATVDNARVLAFDGKHTSARDTLIKFLGVHPRHTGARELLGRTHSWAGNYKEAREQFNKITSQDHGKRDAWIAAVKNELYARNDATALGLANKALIYLKKDREIERLRAIALSNLQNKKYKRYTKQDTLQPPLVAPSKAPQKSKKKKIKKATEKALEEAANAEEKKRPKNTFGVTNAFTIFSEVYEPNVASTITLKRVTKFGSIIPRISYGNRFQMQGLQYGISAYPKITKKMYAYLSYAYSNAAIYPNHSMGGDLYASLPGAIEASAGMRHMSFDSRDLTIITNSLGLYKGNYYYSLRSYITPKSNNLTRVSGNFVVRKYLKDGENYLGASAGIGYSPELRQIILDGTLLSETLLYLESQRISLEYQFTGKNTPNIYKTRLGLARRELFSEPGSFLFSVSAGLTYKVKF